MSMNECSYRQKGFCLLLSCTCTCISISAFSLVTCTCIDCSLNGGLQMCRSECFNYLTVTCNGTRSSYLLSIVPFGNEKLKHIHYINLQIHK